jgi:hypothetical protein
MRAGWAGSVVASMWLLSMAIVMAPLMAEAVSAGGQACPH